MIPGYHYRGLILGIPCFRCANLNIYISGLMNSKSEVNSSGPESFPERGGYQFAFQWF